MMPCINIKTGNKYFVVGSVINATNEQDGQFMLLYKNEEGDMFVREKEEFMEKFIME